ncbi:hypothetical protein C4D60_Mb04t10410 [Musa balbisiana]|uniref:Uncharacterized protein n=1 Tax=Musa balbisiana TaxID=52838 RepID=A0A4S8KB59_MUSBA|nr:hypothetical protein C4D60_Mb04t10410 [Musa balbisiana]
MDILLHVGFVGHVRFAANYKYSESLSTLMYHPYSWTKVIFFQCNFCFVDIPVGTGFLFVKDSASADEVGDMSSSLQVYDFLTKTVPLVAHLISKGNSRSKSGSYDHHILLQE